MWQASTVASARPTWPVRWARSSPARSSFLVEPTPPIRPTNRGAVNAVVDHEELETEALQWAREICGKSPTAQRMAKFAFNLIDDGLVGQQVFAGEATRLAYMTDEAREGRDAFLEKRAPDWSDFPYHY